MIRDVAHRGRSWRISDENEHTAWVIDQLAEGWETDTFETVDEYVKGGVFVDVGAWIGMFSLYAAPMAQWVFALEPDPVARRMLNKNLCLNGVKNVTVLGAALWDSAGTETFYTQTELGDSMTGPTRRGSPVTVRTIVADDLLGLIGKEPIDLVKVDTEGSECRILPGIIGWPAPIHLSVHEPDLTGTLDYAGREVKQLTTGMYHTVVLT